MSIFQKIGQLPNKLLYNMGKRSYAEYFIKQLNPKDQKKAKQYFKDLSTLDTAADPFVYFKKLGEFGSYITECQARASGEEVSKFYTFGNNPNTFGPRPQGSKIWSFFPNPFGVFSYFEENYWAVGRCIDLMRETIRNDGFALKAADGVSQEKLVDYYKQLNDLDIKTLWVEYCIHKALFGNFFGMAHYGKRSRKVVKYEILYPPRLIPVINNNTEEIDSYEYYVGRIRRFYTLEEVDHAMNPTTQGKALGPPPLLSCTVEIETALTTMNFNNDVMQKGTLLGKIIALEVPEGDSITNSVNSDWVRQVQNHLQYLHSGTKSGQGMAAIAGVKNVYDITKPGEVELNFRESRPELDKRISNRLGIPSEKIGVPRSATLQYQPSLVENVVNAQFDATINSYTVDAADFFNKFLLQDKLGIYDAKLVPAGRYGAITLAAAQTIKELAAGGPIITVNEAREKILGWEPLPPGDPRGNMVLNNATGVPLEQGPTMIAPEVLDPELNLDKDFDKISQGRTLFVKIGGIDDGTISTSRPRIYREVFQAENQKG